MGMGRVRGLKMKWQMDEWISSRREGGRVRVEK